MVELIVENIINKSDKLQEMTEYIPLVLHRFLPNPNQYYDNMSHDAELEYFRKRTELQGDEYYSYLEDELLEWLKEHKDFEDIIDG